MSAVHWFWGASFCFVLKLHMQTHWNIWNHRFFFWYQKKKKNDGPIQGMNGCRILRCSMCSSSFSGFFVSSLCPCCCSLITFRGSQERGIRLRDWRLDCALLCLSLTCICLLSQALAPGSTLEFLSSSDFVCWWQLAGPLLGSFGRWLSCLAVALLPSFVLAAPMMLCRICF